MGQAYRGKAWIGFSGRATADELRDRLDLICFQLHQLSPCTCIEELGRLPFLYAAYKVFFRYPDCMCLQVACAQLWSGLKRLLSIGTRHFHAAHAVFLRADRMKSQSVGPGDLYACVWKRSQPLA